MRRSEQRRAAVVALYQHDLTGRPLAETLSRNDSLFVRALAESERRQRAKCAPAGQGSVRPGR